eukprot:Rhum_TRINITY_DN14611_c42_g1::Rhum_TRINITY_DN14611_c42_g1_i1::g.103525::m.103525
MPPMASEDGRPQGSQPIAMVRRGSITSAHTGGCAGGSALGSGSFSKRAALPTGKKPNLRSLVGGGAAAGAGGAHGGHGSASSLVSSGSEDGLGCGSFFSSGSFSDPAAHRMQRARSCELYLTLLDEIEIEQQGGLSPTTPIPFSRPAVSPHHGSGGAHHGMCRSASSFDSESVARIHSCLKQAEEGRRRAKSDSVKRMSWAPELVTPEASRRPYIMAPTTSSWDELE